jgi:hypothetical protein
MTGGIYSATPTGCCIGAYDAVGYGACIIDIIQEQTAAVVIPGSTPGETASDGKAIKADVLYAIQNNNVIRLMVRMYPASIDDSWVIRDIAF